MRPLGWARCRDGHDRRTELLDGALQWAEGVDELAARRQCAWTASRDHEALHGGRLRVARCCAAPGVARNLYRLLLVDAVRLAFQEPVVPTGREVEDVYEVGTGEARRR